MFFSQLSQKFNKIGLETSKIHLCVGDFLFWGCDNSTSYRGTFSNWQRYLLTYFQDYGVTDIVFMSDSRPYHSVAVEVAKKMKVNVFVFENGYLRPDWITMEQGGVNGRSGFTKDPLEICELAAKARESSLQFSGCSKPSSLRLYAGDTLFHATNFVLSFVFPNYDSFRNVSALTEARGWIKKAVTRPGKIFRSRRALTKLLDSRNSFFFFPLQLEHDYQLKVDSPFTSITHACETVISSFATNAPLGAKLLIKNHPLDNNIINREKEIARLAGLHGVGDRIVFVEVGHNPSIFQKTAGMVTINSTMGTSALHHNVPICVLGKAVYNVKGLVHDGDLDHFWKALDKCQSSLNEDFTKALIAHCQIKGHFSETNPESGVFEHCAAKILAVGYRSSNQKRDQSIEGNNSHLSSTLASSLESAFRSNGH